MKFTTIVQIFSLLAALLCFARDSTATVTPFFSAGADCTGSSTANFSAKSTTRVSLCVATTLPSEKLCGHISYSPRPSNDADNGAFDITARAIGTSFTSITDASIVFPQTVTTAPLNIVDFGAHPFLLAPSAAPATLLLQTFDLLPQPLATHPLANTTFVIGMGANSVVSVDADGACGLNGTASIPLATTTATLTLNRALVAPEFTSGVPAVGRIGWEYTHYFKVSGWPASTFSVPPGSLPAGLSLATVNNGVGVLTGTPTVTGTFNFVVTASNGVGTLPTTQSVVLVIASAAPVLTGVYSRKNHGAETFDLPIAYTIPINGPVDVDPRVTDTDHSIVFRFDTPIAAAGSASAAIGYGAPPQGVGTSFSGNEVIVSIQTIPDKSRVAISLNGVNGDVKATANLGFLIGDVNNSRSVNGSDTSAIQLRSGQTVTQANFKYDLGGSGVITAADIAMAKAKLGSTLP